MTALLTSLGVVDIDAVALFSFSSLVTSGSHPIPEPTLALPPQTTSIPILLPPTALVKTDRRSSSVVPLLCDSIKHGVQHL